MQVQILYSRDEAKYNSIIFVTGSKLSKSQLICATTQLIHDETMLNLTSVAINKKNRHNPIGLYLQTKLLQFFFVGTFFQKDAKDVLLNVNLELGLLNLVEPLPGLPLNLYDFALCSSAT